MKRRFLVEVVSKADGGVLVGFAVAAVKGDSEAVGVGEYLICVGEGFGLLGAADPAASNANSHEGAPTRELHPLGTSPFAMAHLCHAMRTAEFDASEDIFGALGIFILCRARRAAPTLESPSKSPFGGVTVLKSKRYGATTCAASGVAISSKVLKSYPGTRPSALAFAISSRRKSA